MVAAPLLLARIQLFLLLQMAGLRAANVALKTSGNYCAFRHLSEIIFDGITNVDMVEILTEHCTRMAYIDINLTFLYSIQYIVIYEGMGINTGQLDFFIVYNMEGNRTTKCSEYPGPSMGAINGSGMRVNCKPTTETFSKVRIESRKNEGFFISEIEVHSLGSSDGNILIYRGCFRHFTGSKAIKSFGQCREMCLLEEYLFAAIKNRTECYCSSFYDDLDEIPDFACGMECDDGKHYCGGAGSYSVYLLQVVLPSYHGCIRLDGPEDAYADPEMTIEKCLQHCVNEKFALLSRAERCSCDNVYAGTADTSPYNSCISGCIGENQKYCGGENHISAYLECKDSKGNLSCFSLAKCNGRIDMYGSCNGKCLPTFSGEFCLEKDSLFPSTSPTTASVPYTHPAMPTNACVTSDPCGKRANAECIEYGGKARCECLSGYAINHVDSSCEDIDECEYEPCDESFSTCQNLEGSLLCACKQGFVLTSRDICITAGNKTNPFTFGHLFNSRRVIMILLLPVLVSILFMAAAICCTSTQSGE